MDMHDQIFGAHCEVEHQDRLLVHPSIIPGSMWVEFRQHGDRADRSVRLSEDDATRLRDYLNAAYQTTPSTPDIAQTLREAGMDVA